MFVIYNPTTGDVLQTASVSRESDFREMLQQQGTAFVETDDLNVMPLDWWVEENTLSEKADFPLPTKTVILADDVDSTTFSGLPASTRLFVDGTQVGIIEDGSLDLTLDVAGFYRIRLEARGYKPKEVVIEAQAV